MKIIVASQNPVKINASKAAFRSTFPDQEFEFIGISVESGVPDQPIGIEEIRKGAVNRANSALAAHPDADFALGLEGGILEIGDSFQCIAMMHLKHKSGKTSEAHTSSFTLPPKICEMIRSGMELGDASAKFFNHENSKQKNGAVGLLTGDLVTRTDYYEQALVLALIPFRNPELY